jgi:long-chain acyl-CoA synthetase
MTPPASAAAILAHLARSNRARPVITFVRSNGTRDVLQGPRLAEQAEQVAARLHGMGVRAGDFVMVLIGNRPAFVPAILGIMRIGAVAVPTNPALDLEDRRFIVEATDAKVIVVDAEGLPLAEPVAGARPIMVVDQAGATGGVGSAPPPPERLAELAGLALFTSGTTARPRGVLLSQRAAFFNGHAMARRLRSEGATQLAVLPLFHAHAFGFGLVSALTTDGHVLVTESFDPFGWAELVARESVEVTSVVPHMLELLLRVKLHRSKVPTLTKVLVSSAPLSAELAARFVSATEIPLVQGWGLSEFTNFATCMVPPPTGGPDIADGLTSVGSPLDGVEVAVMNDELEPLPPGATGELFVRGPCRMLGYHADAASTAAVTHGEWLRTGDLGFMRPSDAGPELFIAGRRKELIIRAGDKLSPLAIERKLCLRVPELAGRLVVLGGPHAIMGEEVVAYIEHDAFDAALEAKLRAAIAELTTIERPKVVLHGPQAIPRTHTGKVQRRKLVPWFEAYARHTGPLHIARWPATA